GAQLPMVFRVGIRNGQAAEDRYAVQVSNVPAGWEAVTSVHGIDVPAGQTAELGLVLRPTGALPPPGTIASFTVTVTSTGNPAVTQTQTETFTVPNIDAVTLSSNPAQVNTVPGVAATATLTVTNAGNVPETVALSSGSSAGLTVSGLHALTLA